VPKELLDKLKGEPERSPLDRDDDPRGGMQSPD
jgi:hypothetical protein